MKVFRYCPRSVLVPEKVSVLILVGMGIFYFSAIAATDPPNRAPVSVPQSLLEPTTHSVLVRATTETLELVRANIERKLSAITTIACTVEMSKKRDKKITRKVYTGPLLIRRETGGHLILTRKGETEEYIANARFLYAYDHKKKEATVIPIRSPILGYFVTEALRFNAFLAIDQETLRFLGTQTTNGEPCWVFEGKSPKRLRIFGVPVRKMRVWVAIRDGLPREIRIPEEKDLTIVLRDYAINQPVSESEFDWKAPSGVRVKNILGF